MKKIGFLTGLYLVLTLLFIVFIIPFISSGIVKFIIAAALGWLIYEAIKTDELLSKTDVFVCKRHETYKQEE